MLRYRLKISLKRLAKKRRFAFLALHIFLGSGPSSFAQQPLNAVIGDAGYISKFQKTPDTNASECDRITAHLAYVLEKLDSVFPQNLPPSQAANRAKCLAHLANYISAGQFPENREYPGRRPIFIDPNGTYCAVGYLIAQTAGPTAAAEIDRFHHGDYVSDMDVSLLQPWADAHGFTLTELAMIQPTYGCSGPSPSWRGKMQPLLAEAGIACPGVEGPFLLECRFSVSNLKPDYIRFSNQEHPEINRKLEKFIRETTFFPGRCFDGHDEPKDGGPYTLRILFNTDSPSERDAEAQLKQQRYAGLSQYFQTIRVLQAKNQAKNIALMEKDVPKSLKVGGKISEEWLGGRPLEGIKIEAFDEQGEVVKAVETDKNGSFLFYFPNPKPGAYIQLTATRFNQHIRLPIEWVDGNMKLFFWGDITRMGGGSKVDKKINLNGC